MTLINLTADRLNDALVVVPEDQPVHMLNLLRFHERARYEPGADVAPCSGVDAYLGHYVPAFNAVIEPLGGSHLLYAGSVAASLVGPDDRWDAVAIVTYPTMSVFQALIEHPDYHRMAEPHRRAALANWQLLATTTLT